MRGGKHERKLYTCVTYKRIKRIGLKKTRLPWDDIEEHSQSRGTHIPISQLYSIWPSIRTLKFLLGPTLYHMWGFIVRNWDTPTHLMLLHA